MDPKKNYCTRKENNNRKDNIVPFVKHFSIEFSTACESEIYICELSEASFCGENMVVII